MKQALATAHFLFFVLVFSSNIFSQPTTTNPVIEFENDSLVVNVDNESDSCLKYYFKFRNIGNVPVIIENAQGSDPDFPFYYPRNPVIPGTTDSIGIVLVRQQLAIPRLRRIYSVHYNGGFKKFIYFVRIHKRKD